MGYTYPVQYCTILVRSYQTMEGEEDTKLPIPVLFPLALFLCILWIGPHVTKTKLAPSSWERPTRVGGGTPSTHAKRGEEMPETRLCQDPPPRPTKSGSAHSESRRAPQPAQGPARPPRPSAAAAGSGGRPARPARPGQTRAVASHLGVAEPPHVGPKASWMTTDVLFEGPKKWAQNGQKGWKWAGLPRFGVKNRFFFA